MKSNHDFQPACRGAADKGGAGSDFIPVPSPPRQASRTWESLADAARGIRLMLQGNCYYAIQVPDGSFRPSYKLKLLDETESIINGDLTPGFYSIRRDQMTRWAAADYDSHGPSDVTDWLPQATRAFDSLKGHFAEVWLVESGSNQSTGMHGYHVIAFDERLRPASEMRSLVSAACPGCKEVFPKQDTIDLNDARAKGNLLRFPGRHQRKQTWSRLLAAHGQVLEVEVEPLDISGERDAETIRLRRLYDVATAGIMVTGNGQRHSAMTRIVGRLKGRTESAEDARWVHARWYRQNGHNFATSEKESLEAFLRWFAKAKPSVVEFPVFPLTAEEESIVARVGKAKDLVHDDLREAARMFYRAWRLARGQGRGFFWVSTLDIADRIPCSAKTASRLRLALVEQGVVECLAVGHTGKASEYRFNPGWLPSGSCNPSPLPIVRDPSACASSIPDGWSALVSSVTDNHSTL